MPKTHLPFPYNTFTISLVKAPLSPNGWTIIIRGQKHSPNHEIMVTQTPPNKEGLVLLTITEKPPLSHCSNNTKDFETELTIPVSKATSFQAITPKGEPISEKMTLPNLQPTESA